MVISPTQLASIDTIREEIIIDSKFRGIRDLIKMSNSNSRYSLKQRTLFFKGWLVIPKHSFLILKLFHDFHSSLEGGHSGFFCTSK